jgi:glycogen synthase
LRILFLSNHYPPHSRGGYELWCQEVAQALHYRGHEVQILTTKSATANSIDDDNGVKVHRELWPEVEGTLGHTILRLLNDRHRLDQENLQTVRELVASFQPEVALIWGMWNVPRSVPALLEKLLPDRVVYYISDYWLSLPNAYIQRWQEPARRTFAQLPKRLLAKYFLAKLMKEPVVELKLEHPICVSQAVLEILVGKGVPVSHAQVIYGGIQVDDFLYSKPDRQNQKNGRLNLLYLGRLAPEKGVHTAIDALTQLELSKNTKLKFNIYGRGDASYEAHLRFLVKQGCLEDMVSFCEAVPYNQLSRVFAQHEVLIFPSEWQEPFGRVLVEGMAAGLVVIGTRTGGAADILKGEENCLAFEPGNSIELATQIIRLWQSPQLMEDLQKNGLLTAKKRFNLNQMVDKIEVYLMRIANCTPS